MTSNLSEFGTRETRQRRTHTKSRRGCRNCKLRRTKCDEGQPQCTKCLSFGVVCNYNPSHGADLEPSWQATPSKIKQLPLNQMVFNASPEAPMLRLSVGVGDGPRSFTMDPDSLARLDRFQKRTVFTFGGQSAFRVYQNDVTRLAIKHPFLMHIILAITATHDRYLSVTLNNSKRSLSEAYHSARGATLLVEKLSNPIMYEDRDAIWASAAMLGIASMTSVDASDPAEAWPMKKFNPSDLDWLNMAVGKEAIWRATNPLRPDSIFHGMADDFRALMHRPPLRALEEIPKDFVHLLSLDGPVPLDKNPYYTAISVLAGLWRDSCTRDSMPTYMGFLNYMDPSFRSLLLLKDPRALLIFGYWYACMQGSQWWVHNRAQLECQAICLYLEKYHASDIDIQRMLVYPKMRCGIGS
ncbi:hypothetical protein N7456_007949 [Penicillium angulare]|uniref:Zn(2)-C6 fungal-type domain-containing protein n=1 Tax=Penicillium angulare TaxID=116970 RepID=A0A9W9K8R6_9EURO|nr:hypothetical protein N7456_007949 [Penicillium angulare]